MGQFLVQFIPLGGSILSAIQQIDDLSYQSRLISRDFCQQTKLNKTSDLKKKLELAFEEFEGGQYCFLHLAKMAITEFINLNFSV